MTLFDAFKLPVKRFFIFILCYQFTVIIGSPSKSNQTLAIHDPLVNFIFVGPTNAFWQHLPDHSFDRVSSKCVRSIEHVLDTVQTGHQWAYQSNSFHTQKFGPSHHIVTA